MRILCNKDELLNGLQIVSKAVPTRTTMNILECILVDTTKNDIRLIANDTELGIQTIIEGNIESKGIIALDAKLFLEIIRKLPDGEIAIESDPKNIVNITCGKSKFNVVGRSGEDFTYLPQVETTNNLIISQFTLKEVIRQTIFSIAENSNNKVLGGELFEINEDTLTVTAIDGHRIAIRKIKLKNNYEAKKLIIPGKTLNDISKILPGGAEDDVVISYTDKHVIFEFDSTIVVSRLIDGEFFKTEQMLSYGYDTKMKVNKKDLLNSIERATLLSKEGDKKPIIFNVTDTYVELTMKSNIGSMDESLDIEKQGKDILIGFNPKFMIDALRAIDDEYVDLFMVNSKTPCFIKDAEGNYTYLVLPVNFATVAV